MDVLDSMLRLYSTKAGTRRWPMAVFYDILDKSAINAWILYKETTLEKISRHKFIITLAKQLCGDEFIDDDIQESTSKKPESRKRKTCSASKCSNKSLKVCKTCHLIFCGKHLHQNNSYFCNKCKNYE